MKPAIAIALAFVVVFVILAAMRTDWFGEAELPQELSNAR